MVIFINFFRRFARRVLQSNIFVIMGLTAALILVGTLAYAHIEGWSWLDALYATIITITTVGYGDFSPQTANGRLFAIFFTFIAIGIGGYAISTFAAYLIESRVEKRTKFLRKRRAQTIPLWGRLCTHSCRYERPRNGYPHDEPRNWQLVVHTQRS
ncbi:potassium channel family protein [Candidatus Leptofilum sp.]|uniref:potassium channel family protein n=1 Tax=Candidatus Leptofilum sp. TaxID=3241576 RepID=UPI003B5BB4E7